MWVISAVKWPIAIYCVRSLVTAAPSWRCVEEDRKNMSGLEPKPRYMSYLAITIDRTGGQKNDVSWFTFPVAYLFCVKQVRCRGRSLKRKQGAVHPSEKSIAVNGQPKCVRQTRQTGTPSHCRDWTQKVGWWTLHVRIVRHYLRH